MRTRLRRRALRWGAPLIILAAGGLAWSAGARTPGTPVLLPDVPALSGLAVGRDGSLYVGEEFGSVWRIAPRRTPEQVLPLEMGGAGFPIPGGGLVFIRGGPLSRTEVAAGAQEDVYAATTWGGPASGIRVGGRRVATIPLNDALPSGRGKSPARVCLATDATGVLCAIVSPRDPWRARDGLSRAPRLLRMGADGKLHPLGGGPAPFTRLAHEAGWSGSVTDVAVAPDGSLYIAGAYAVWKLGPDGSLRRVVGGWHAGFRGDGGPAVQAWVSGIRSLACGADGSLYLVDSWNTRVRKVDPSGIITTVAGDGKRKDSGDGGPATAASLEDPRDVAVGPDGSVYVTEGFPGCVRRIDPSAMITTVARCGRRLPR